VRKKKTLLSAPNRGGTVTNIRLIKIDGGKRGKQFGTYTSEKKLPQSAKGKRKGKNTAKTSTERVLLLIKKIMLRLHGGGIPGGNPGIGDVLFRRRCPETSTQI